MNKEITEETYIKFHQLIDNGDEEEAIKLLKECGESFDVNYEYKQRIPVFSAVSKLMYNLYDEIINHPTFNSRIEDGFGEPLLESLLYLRGENATDEIPIIAVSGKEVLDRMIKTILNCERYDFNATDINIDTAINLSCEYPNLLWVTKELVNKECVNPNVINDFGNTALTNAICNNNVEAIKLLSKRKDLIVRNKDIEVAKEKGIDLADFGLNKGTKAKVITSQLTYNRVESF